MLSKFKKNIYKLKEFFKSTLKDGSEFTEDTKRKLANLYETNLDTAISYILDKRLGYAVFRFYIMEKLWPNEIEPKFYNAICLILMKKFDKSEKKLKEVEGLDPNYKDLKTAFELLEKEKEKFKKEQEEAKKKKEEALEKKKNKRSYNKEKEENDNDK